MNRRVGLMQVGLCLICLIASLGCDLESELLVRQPDNVIAPPIEAPPGAVAQPDTSVSGQRLPLEKKSFATNIVKQGESLGPVEDPSGSDFAMAKYNAPVGELPAYITKDPQDGKKHPAIIWITGGDCNSIGNVWSINERSNDQSAAGFRQAGVVMMFPALRGGNDNPGRREGFYGEVDDVIAAADYLAKVPYVDANQIYLGGHSTGGTLVLLVAASTDRFKAIFSLGPVAAVSQYGGEYVYCDLANEKEIELRSPIYWMADIKTPTFVFEGQDGNWDGSIDVMQRENHNPNLTFHRIIRHDHFSIIAPLTERLGKQIIDGGIDVNKLRLTRLD